MPKLEYEDGVAKLPHHTRLRKKLVPTEIIVNKFLNQTNEIRFYDNQRLFAFKTVFHNKTSLGMTIYICNSQENYLKHKTSEKKRFLREGLKYKNTNPPITDKLLLQGLYAELYRALVLKKTELGLRKFIIDLELDCDLDVDSSIYPNVNEIKHKLHIDDFCPADLSNDPMAMAMEVEDDNGVIHKFKAKFTKKTEIIGGSWSQEDEEV